MMTHYSWYLSPELATLGLFSHHLSFEDKADLVQRNKSDRGSLLLKCLTENLCQLQIHEAFSRSLAMKATFCSKKSALGEIFHHIRLQQIW